MNLFRFIFSYISFMSVLVGSGLMIKGWASSEGSILFIGIFVFAIAIGLIFIAGKLVKEQYRKKARGYFFVNGIIVCFQILVFTIPVAMLMQGMMPEGFHHWKKGEYDNF